MSYAVGAIALVIAAVAASRFTKLAHIPQTAPPALSLLERWYHRQPVPRRVGGAVLEWTLSLEQTQQRVDGLFAKFARLRRFVVETEMGELKWEQGNAVCVVEECDDKEMDWERKLGAMLSLQSGLMHVVVNEHRQVLLVTMNHVLVDGKGFAAFMDVLLGDWTDDDVGEEEEPVENRLKLDLSVAGLLAKLWREPRAGFVGPLLKKEESGCTTAATLVKGFTLPSATCSGLIEQCRRHHATLTSLLTAACSQAVFDLVQRPFVSQVQIPVSLRQRRDGREIGGNHVAPFAINIDCSGAGANEVWTNAAFVRRQLVLELPTIHTNLGLLAFAGDFTQYQLRKQDKLATVAQRTSTVEVSNLGVCPNRPWYFAQGNHYLGPLFALNCVTACNGDLCCTVTVSTLAVSPKQLDLFCLGLQAHLLLMHAH